jgi:hypothetical protein
VQEWHVPSAKKRIGHGWRVPLPHCILDCLHTWLACSPVFLLDFGKFQKRIKGKTFLLRLGVFLSPSSPEQIFIKAVQLILLQLFDVAYREETLMNVIRSVTRNGRSIILTAILGIILVYLFSIVGYLFFQHDFIIDVDPLNRTGWRVV